MSTHQVYLHPGRVLWPEHKSLEEVLQLRATTPDSAWWATWQGQATPPGGTVFKREWWSRPDTRYDWHDQALINRCWGRYLSIDTAQKAEEENDYFAYVVGELWPDYRLAIRLVHQAKLEFPDLPAEIERLAQRWNRDMKLRGIIIEDKGAGTSALQTLRAAAAVPSETLIPFVPTTSKVTRAEQAAVWCNLACVLLPRPDVSLPWLVDFEDQLFDFPGAVNDDMVDGLTQLVLYLEHLLEAGHFARQGDLAHMEK